MTTGRTETRTHVEQENGRGAGTVKSEWQTMVFGAFNFSRRFARDTVYWRPSCFAHFSDMDLHVIRLHDTPGIWRGIAGTLLA